MITRPCQITYSKYPLLPIIRSVTTASLARLYPCRVVDVVSRCCDLLLIVHGNGYNICIVFGLDFDLIGFDSNSNSMLRFIRVWRGDPFQN